MNIVISLIISMAANWLGGVVRKYFTNRFSGKAATRHIYNAVVSFVSAVVLFLWGGFGTASLFTILLGTVFGIVTALQQIANLKAIETGPWAYTTVITALSMLIPTLSGVLIWHEQIRALQIIGILFMVVCLILSVDAGGDTEKRKTTFRWLLFCGAAFLCTGSIGVMQKWHQSSDFKSELNAFLIIAFAISFLYSAVMALILRMKKEAPADVSDMGGVPAENKKSAWGAILLPLLIMVVGGICVSLNNKLNLYLSGVMPSAVFFPLVNGGGLILTTISAFLLFRERLSLRQWIGLGAGFIAVLLLCL